MKTTWTDLIVKTQIRTLVMHGWSKIEHDMTYKPPEPRIISEGQVCLHDLISSTVTTGEPALRQLEAITERRRNQYAKDKEAFAMSGHGFGCWLEKYGVEANHVKIEGDWDYLTQLFAILKHARDHQLDKIQQILEAIEFKGAIADILFDHARFWATQSMYSLDMVAFLGVT
ncbi:hypothetical protein PFICI_07094 [Pestalotiopsis fici W106-1]|uniref:Uncharacterized protein n=1 Tax=Pestalotiopsis fici (strain W106-1 / CGMCC3.15140) TaxID=1229662 RepID=W3X9K0_PESFW|nr:uncharacterized protein PFICI_07094 [Pestalotiopsis fici W106-1]ETS82092.1 hypothetical protein PFICI_07094 [Pestalotiopsis fici W106-1]